MADKKRCDGSRQCPMGDDEWYCDVSCPSSCACVGLTYICSNAMLHVVPKEISWLARKLDLSGNNLTLAAVNEDYNRYTFLGELLLSRNQIRDLPQRVFKNLLNLYKLDLSHNDIQMLQQGAFEGLANIRILNLEGNTKLSLIRSYAFAGLHTLPFLDLQNTGLERIEPGAFSNLSDLQQLDLSRNNLLTLSDVFVGLDGLRSLNISRNPGLFIQRQEFDELFLLRTLESDDFKYCCFVNDRVAAENCLPAKDEFSSCQDLMSREVLKAFLWILGLMAFVFNLFVLLWRRREKTTVGSFFIMNLAASDFLMGIYMVVLASVDAYYRGVYIEYAKDWTGSWLCQALGVINTLSSEASVFTLCIITLHRVYVIVYPLRSALFSMKVARLLVLGAWMVALVLSLLPLLPLEYFGGQFYGRSSVCISIYLTNEKTPGWEFSVAVYHGINFFSFVLIFLSYAYIYFVVKNTRSTARKGSHTPSQSDIALARKLAVIVATDFLCWVPINIMGKGYFIIYTILYLTRM